MAKHNCPDLLAHLSDFVDGDLDPQICRQIEQHIDGCTHCRTVVETLENTVALYHSLPEKRLPTEAAERLCAALGLAGEFDE